MRKITKLIRKKFLKLIDIKEISVYNKLYDLALHHDKALN